MPVIKLYPNGSTCGTPNQSKHERVKRDVVKGWSPRSVKGQRDWFYSVELDGLRGPLIGHSFTLTLRDTPETAEDFHKLREAFFARQRRKGMVRAHWLIEWQARKSPHLHGILYYPTQSAGNLIIPDWLEVAKDYRPSWQGQHTCEIYSIRGWLQYLAKHGSRGVKHYQRDNVNIPPGWEKTGRLWGHLGDWPTRSPMKFGINQEGYWVYRRLIRSWAIAAARAEGKPHQIRYARQMLKSSDPGMSPVRGTSEWVPTDLGVRFLAFLSGEGFRITQDDG